MSAINFLRMSEDEARNYLEKLRWPDGPCCIKCGSVEGIIRVGGKSHRPGLLHCKSCRKQFTVTVGTIFEDSHIPLSKWIAAFHLMCSSKKGISALQLQRLLDLKSYKSAWHLAHRIRYAMKSDLMGPKLKGIVEVDETYVGGKFRGGKRGRGSENKTPVVALVERNGNIRTKIVNRVSANQLRGAILENVNENSILMTDELASYDGIGKHFLGGHQTVNHSKGEYVRDLAYTNTAESFFALLKRGVYGSFHHVSKEHLHRYCDEFSFRWDMRKNDDTEKTEKAIASTEGKRLYYQMPKAG